MKEINKLEAYHCYGGKCTCRCNMPANPYGLRSDPGNRYLEASGYGGCSSYYVLVPKHIHTVSRPADDMRECEIECRIIGGTVKDCTPI